MASDILIVDDETDIRELVAGILSDEGHDTRTAHDADSALASIADRVPRLVFLDIWLQGSRLDGLALLDEIKTMHPNLPVVMISGHGNIETAVSAIRRGAYDFIEKPFKADRLILVAERALETSKLKREVAELKSRSGETYELIGMSSAMTQLRQTIDRVAPTNSRIMIIGPSGSGKEMVAALSETNGPPLRGDAAWTARATISFPDPDGPMIMIRLLVGATRSMVWRNCVIADDMPISSYVSPLRDLSSETSRLSFEVSSARSATRMSLSALNGFSMKS